jgi:hypothetical protein
MAQLTAAALVAEYLTRLGRIPRYFPGESAADHFRIVCPSADSERCPPEVLTDLPRIHGFCTGKYFSEYGLVNLLLCAMNNCKRAALYELRTKIHVLLSPIAEHRRLWRLLQTHFHDGSFSWQVISQQAASADRALGQYYMVRFRGEKCGSATFIYRETGFTRLADVNNRFRESMKFFARDKPIEVTNEGDQIPDDLPPGHYYILVKAVSPYFTAEERKRRKTVFEQHHELTRFFYDRPFSKSSQSSIESCWLIRTVFTLPHPMPYIVKRVEIPADHIEKFEFSPIQHACQDLRSQVEKMEECLNTLQLHEKSFTEPTASGLAEIGRVFAALQPMLQGSLLTQVNEGAMKIAEVFLGRDEAKGGDDAEYREELRGIFRGFLDVMQRGVAAHEKWAQIKPVYLALQEKLEDGLTTVTSALQPYLK